MSQADYDLIRSGVERRLAAVETLIPSQACVALGRRPRDTTRPRPSRRRDQPYAKGPTAVGRRWALILVGVGALLVLTIGYGLLGGGQSQQEPTSPPKP